MTSPRVFISYAWQPAEHKAWVKRLAVQLRRDGIDAVLDVWHARGRNILSFMTSEIRNADLVLAVCTPEYREKVHATEDGQRQSGVGWEIGAVVSQLFFDNESKFVAVLARGTWETAAPDVLRPYDFIDLSDESQLAAGYERLRQRLLGREEQAPALGDLPEDEADGPPIGLLDTPSASPVPAGPSPRGAPRRQPPHPLLPFRLDREAQKDQTTDGLDAAFHPFAAGELTSPKLLVCFMHAPKVERPDALLDCLREYTIKEYLETRQLQPAIELPVAWPPGTGDADRRLGSLKRSLLGELKKQIPTQPEEALDTVEQCLERLDGSLLVRVRIEGSRLDRSDEALLERWLEYWAELRAVIEHKAEEAAQLRVALPAERQIVVVLVCLEYGTQSRLKSLFGGLLDRKLTRTVGFFESPSKPDSGLIEVGPLKALEPVPVGVLSQWLERHVRPWTVEAFGADAALGVEESIRRELDDAFDFEAAPNKAMPMKTLSQKIADVLDKEIKQHGD